MALKASSKVACLDIGSIVYEEHYWQNNGYTIHINIQIFYQ